VLVEQVLIHLHDGLAVARVHPHLIVAHPAGQPQPRDRGPRGPHVDGQLPAQVEPRFAFLVPGVGQQRLAVPFLEHKPDVDVLLQAAYPQLLAVRGDKDADGGQRAAWRVRVHLGVVNAEHAAIGEDRHYQLQ
jgi:hypothetical protein